VGGLLRTPCAPLVFDPVLRPDPTMSIASLPNCPQDIPNRISEPGCERQSSS